MPVAYACIKNDLPMVELLVAHGADIRAADNIGRNPAAPGGRTGAIRSSRNG